MDLRRTSKISHAIMKASSSSSSSSSSGETVGQRHHQRAARRQLPVIRVIHIFNPTVIKTDVANFRSLVQELTGRKSLGSDKGTATARSRSVYDGQLKQLQSTAKEFMSHKPQLLGYISGAEDPQNVFRNSPTITTKRSPMYIPERLGTFSELGEIVSSWQEPLMDFNNLMPSLGEVGDENGLHAVMPRFTSFYESS